MARAPKQKKPAKRKLLIYLKWMTPLVWSHKQHNEVMLQEQVQEFSGPGASCSGL